MLSSVLNSQRAIEVNIAIMRAFVHLRKMIASHKELAKKLKELEHHIKDHDEKILAIFEAIQRLVPGFCTSRRLSYARHLRAQP
jgi:hypothetical protein